MTQTGRTCPSGPTASKPIQPISGALVPRGGCSNGGASGPAGSTSGGMSGGGPTSSVPAAAVSASPGA
eukprot:1684587-Lingulodinium_polyedra.AAC.1